MNTHAKTTLSSKGQLIIPKFLRSKLGLHLGSEIIMELKDNNILELHPMKKDITSFFGMGKSKNRNKFLSIEDIDEAISKAVSENDKR